MNQTPLLNLLSSGSQSSVNIFFNMLGSELFWVFIIILMSLGRWLLLHETSLFAGKKDDNLTILEKKKKKLLLFFGRGLLGIGLTCFALLLIILIIPTKK